MANGLLQVRGTIDLDQFWPTGGSDADTSLSTEQIVFRECASSVRGPDGQTPSWGVIVNRVRASGSLIAITSQSTFSTATPEGLLFVRRTRSSLRECACDFGNEPLPIPSAGHALHTGMRKQQDERYSLSMPTLHLFIRAVDTSRECNPILTH
jgi:hypothetical protein